MKFTRSLLALSLFSAAQLAVAQESEPDAFIQKLMEEQFPRNEEALKIFNEQNKRKDAIKQCYFNEMGFPSLEQSPKKIDGYCMRFVSEKIADTAQGKRRYVYFTGDRLYSPDIYSSNILFVFTSADGKDWQLLDHKEANYPTHNADAPDSKEKWLETGPGLWGIANEVGIVSNGDVEVAIRILHDDGKEIRESLIPTRYKMSKTERCKDSEYLKSMKQSPADCYAEISELNATIDVRKDLPAVDNTYPLQVTLDGYYGMKMADKERDAKLQPIKEYKRQAFIFSYDPENVRYGWPADFPKIYSYTGDKTGTMW